MKQRKIVFAIIITISTILICSCNSHEVAPLPIDNTIAAMIEYMGYPDCHISKLGDYTTHKILPSLVTETEVNELMQKYVDQYPKEIILNKSTVELNDLLMISFEIIDQSEIIMQVKKQVVKAGTVNFDTNIESSLIGKTVGKPYTINYDNANMNLTNATCTITPLYIYRIEQNTLDDDFTQEHFDYNSVNEWKTAIKEELEKNNLNTAWTNSLDYIIENSSFILNQDCLLEKATNLAYQSAFQATTTGQTLDGYIEQTMGISKDEFYAKCYTSCQRDIQEFLIIGAIASKESLFVTSQELDDYCSKNNLNKETLPEEEKRYVVYHILRNEIMQLLCT